MPAFSAIQGGEGLRQAEIISGITQHIYDPETEEVELIVRPYVVIVSQDCDLERYDMAQDQDKDAILNGVLLYELENEAEAKARWNLNSAAWRQVREHNHPRFHLLPEVPAENDALAQGIPGQVIDFRRFFTMRPREIYRQCNLPAGQGASRRCRLIEPYKEHLQCRIGSYLQRVALPEEPPPQMQAAIALA